MKSFIILIALSFHAVILSAQSPSDSVKTKKAPGIDSLESIIDTLDSPSRKSVTIVSASSQKTGNRDNSTWENRWQNHIDKQSVKIAEQAMLKDSAKKVYKVLLSFSINEDGSLRDVVINCSPANAFVEKQCRNMVMTAPKKSPTYKNGKYVRPHITQPIEIKVK